MIYILIGIVIGVIVGLVVCYFLPKERIRTMNNALIQEEEQKIAELKNRKEQKENELKITESAIETTKRALSDVTNSVDVAKAAIFDQKISALELAQSQYDKGIEIMQERFSKANDSASSEYEAMLKDLAEHYLDKETSCEEKLTVLLDQLNDIQSRVNSAVESNKRAELERTKKDFYRICLSAEDIEEIKKLRSIEPYLRNKEPLNKVIWKSYYEKPTNEMIGRVVGPKVKIGIYKITNLENGMCYIGQAGSGEGFAGRWKQHIKRGIGAETPTRNKLYPAMLTIGVENFMFEILEECSADKLNDREDFWQDFYHARDFGYSIK